MARPTLFTHPKFQRLVYVLGLPRAHVLGHLEMLWRVAYASGDPVVGDEIDVELAAEWTGERGAFVRALADPAIRLLDVIEHGRYAIHDLHEHAPRYVQDRWRKEQARKRAKGGHTADEGRNDGGHAADKRATPTPSPTPAPTPKGEGRADAPSPPSPATVTHRTAPLLRPRLSRDIAFNWRVEVPGFLHDDFLKKLGGDRDEGDRKLSAWYVTVATEWDTPDERPIGDDDCRFWKARFREWQGTTVKADVLPYAGRAAPAFSDWTCPHPQHCGGRWECERKSQLDAARTEAAP